MAVTRLAGKPPLVVKARKTTRIGTDPIRPRVRTGSRDNLVLDMEKQGLTDVRWILREITYEEMRQQQRIDNPATRVIVDNREFKPIETAQRKTEVTFGNILDKLLIKTIERSVIAAVRNSGLSSLPQTSSRGATGPAFGLHGINSIGGWEWKFVEKRGVGGVPLNITKLANLPIGASLVFIPRSRYAGLLNMVAARIDAGWSENRLYYTDDERGVNQSAPSTHKSGGKGFMSKAINKIKRNRLMKNYTIRVMFTSRYKVPGERYGRGTPVIVIQARRSRTYKRIK